LQLDGREGGAEDSHGYKKMHDPMLGWPSSSTSSVVLLPLEIDRASPVSPLYSSSPSPGLFFETPSAGN